MSGPAWGGAAAGDLSEADDVGEVDGDGSEGLSLHVHSALQVLGHLPGHTTRPATRG